jgi:hypothetical protein
MRRSWYALSFHIHGDDVGRDVVAALVSRWRPSTELSRWDTELRTETTCLTKRFKRHWLRSARLNKGWLRFRQVGMPGHGAGVSVKRGAPRREGSPGAAYTSMRLESSWFLLRSVWEFTCATWSRQSE